MTIGIIAVWYNMAFNQWQKQIVPNYFVAMTIVFTLFSFWRNHHIATISTIAVWYNAAFSMPIADSTLLFCINDSNI